MKGKPEKKSKLVEESSPNIPHKQKSALKKTVQPEGSHPQAAPAQQAGLTSQSQHHKLKDSASRSSLKPKSNLNSDFKSLPISDQDRRTSRLSFKVDSLPKSDLKSEPIPQTEEIIAPTYPSRKRSKNPFICCPKLRKKHSRKLLPTNESQPSKKSRCKNVSLDDKKRLKKTIMDEEGVPFRLKSIVKKPTFRFDLKSKSLTSKFPNRHSNIEKYTSMRASLPVWRPSDDIYKDDAEGQKSQNIQTKDSSISDDSESTSDYEKGRKTSSMKKKSVAISDEISTKLFAKLREDDSNANAPSVDKKEVVTKSFSGSEKIPIKQNSSQANKTPPQSDDFQQNRRQSAAQKAKSQADSKSNTNSVDKKEVVTKSFSGSEKIPIKQNPPQANKTLRQSHDFQQNRRQSAAQKEKSPADSKSNADSANKKMELSKSLPRLSRGSVKQNPSQTHKTQVEPVSKPPVKIIPETPLQPSPTLPRQNLSTRISAHARR